jgi:hypothetical protein
MTVLLVIVTTGTAYVAWQAYRLKLRNTAILFALLTLIGAYQAGLPALILGGR